MQFSSSLTTKIIKKPFNHIIGNYNPCLSHFLYERQRAYVLTRNTTTPNPVEEPTVPEPTPIAPVELTIFDDLEARRKSAANYNPRDWKLTRVHEKYAGYVYLDLFLLVIIDLGEKLEPKKSRKSVGRVVNHWTVTDIKLISLHRKANDEHEDDQVFDSGITIEFS